MYLQLLGPVPSIHETVMFMTPMMNFFFCLQRQRMRKLHNSERHE